MARTQAPSHAPGTKSLPDSAFAGPNRSYPVNTRKRAANAKARASAAEHAGRITKAQENRIDAKADKVLGHTAKRKPSHTAH